MSVGGYNKKLPFGEDADLIWKLGTQGKIILLQNVCAYASPRRFRKKGYLKIVFVYWFWNWLYFIITKKPYFDTWEPVR